MTQKHFIAIADSLVAVRDHFVLYHGSDAYLDLIRFTIGVCAENGKRFDRDKFIAYLQNKGVLEAK